MPLEGGTDTFHVRDKGAKMHSMKLQSVQRSDPCSWGVCTDPFHVVAEWRMDLFHVLWEGAMIHSMSLQSAHRSFQCTLRICIYSLHTLGECAQFHNPYHVPECAQIHSMYLESVHTSIPCTWRVRTDPFHTLWDCEQFHSMPLETVRGVFTWYPEDLNTQRYIGWRGFMKNYLLKYLLNLSPPILRYREFIATVRKSLIRFGNCQDSLPL